MNIAWIIPFSWMAVASAASVIPNFSPADLVLGQPDFGPGDPDPLPTAVSLNEPAGVAIDPATGKVFVVDTDNERVLRYATFSSLRNGAAAEAVFGQPDFTSSGSNGVSSQSTDPSGLTIDPLGNLWVAETDQNRVTMFPNAATTGSFPVAAKVLGQADFNSAVAFGGAGGLSGPLDVCFDAVGNLYVSDVSNNRVLRYNDVLHKANGADADAVFGQSDFNLSVSAAGASGLNGPSGLSSGAGGVIWVADKFNNRVVGYANAAFAASPAAFIVLGQPDFDGTSGGTSATRMSVPTKVFEDVRGTLWVVDSGNNRVLGFKNAQTRGNGAAADVVIGQENFTTAIAGAGKRRLTDPFGGLAVDPTGAVWVADLSNNRVLRFSPDGTKPTVKVKGRRLQSTGRSRIKLRGSARDEVAIDEVRVKVGKKTQIAKGDKRWSAKIPLRFGRNVVRVSAMDTAGNRSKTVRVVVVRE